MSLNPSAKLNPDSLDIAKLPQKATRDGYGQGLLEAGKENSQVVALCADLTESTRSLAFKKEFPDRFIQMGVSEQSMVAIAAGLALSGKIPWVSSYSAFCPGRTWDTIRTAVTLNDTNVKIGGAHSGVSVGPDGATHQMTEDIAIMRCLPNIVVLVPCDAVETRKAVVAATRYRGPVYVRFAREKSPVFTDEKTPFEIGKAAVFFEGTDVAIIACGPLVHNALLAASQLEKEGVKARVINNHTIKPMDEGTILKAAQECKAVVTVEEHQVQGGMGSRVAELLAAKLPTPVEFVGMQDRYGESGTPTELIEYFGMGVGAVKDAVKRVLARKKR